MVWLWNALKKKIIPGYGHYSALSLLHPPSPLSPVSAPGRADFGMIRNETLHLDFNCGVITGLNMQVVAGISRRFQGAKSATANCVCVFCILVQNCFGCDVCHLCRSFIISHHNAGGHRRISAASMCRLHETIVSKMSLLAAGFGELQLQAENSV